MRYLVRFPGTPGNYIATDDVNLLDADTAHLHQSIGGWGALGGSDAIQSVALTPVIGSFHGAVTLAGDLSGAQTSGGLNGIPITPNTEYTFSAYEAVDISSSVGEVRVLWYDSGGGYISAHLNTGNIDQAFTRIVTTATSPPTAAFVAIRLLSSTHTPGTVLYWDACEMSEGSDTTFVPSLRIVGDLDETIDPPDMPISFPGDGTPLTIGEGWAGDGYSYIRRDGVGGPIVAQFDPADIASP